MKSCYLLSQIKPKKCINVILPIQLGGDHMKTLSSRSHVSFLALAITHVLLSGSNIPSLSPGWGNATCSRARHLTLTGALNGYQEIYCWG